MCVAIGLREYVLVMIGLDRIERVCIGFDVGFHVEMSGGCF